MKGNYNYADVNCKILYDQDFLGNCHKGEIFF